MSTSECKFNEFKKQVISANKELVKLRIGRTKRKVKGHLNPGTPKDFYLLDQSILLSSTKTTKCLLNNKLYYKAHQPIRIKFTWHGEYDPPMADF